MAAPRSSAENSWRRSTAASASARLGADLVAGGVTWRSLRSLGKHIEAVSPAKWSWLAVVGICLLGTLLLAINGYTGYSITAAAVGAAAAVNLL
jgi:hypothetical protein